MSISLQIEEREHCLKNVGLWKPVGVPTPRIKACSSLSNWVDLIQDSNLCSRNMSVTKGIPLCIFTLRFSLQYIYNLLFVSPVIVKYLGPWSTELPVKPN